MKSDMPESKENNQVYKIALHVELSCVLQLSEALIPHPIPGLRLGMALAFVLPALVTLTHRQRGRVLAAIVLLTAAVVLGASALPRLWARIKPSRPQARMQELRLTIADLKEHINKTEDHIEALGEDSLPRPGRLRIRV